MAVVYTWPLLSQLTTAIPGGPTDRDVATMVWNVGWVQHALTTGAPLLRSDDVLVPFGADLRLHTYGLLQGLLATPLVPLVGVIGAFNLMLLGTLLLNGALAYALILRESNSPPAALVAATCFMLATPLLDQMRVGRPTFASLWLVAAALLTMRSLLAQPRLWHGMLLGLLLVAALLTDFQIALYAVLWLALYALWRLRWKHAPSLALGAVLTSGVFVVVFGGAFASAFGGRIAGAFEGFLGEASAFQVDDYPRPSLADMSVYSFRVWDLVDPQVLQHAYGLELGIAALVAALTLRRNRVWLLGALAFEVLALGPFLQPTQLPLPFAALSAWPPLAQFRTPYRLAMPAALGLAVVLGMVLARWHVSSRTSVAIGLVGARLAMALLLEPFPTQTYPRYAVYEKLARQPERFTLLEVPFGARSGLEQIGQGGEVLQVYQSVHGKPLLNGMIARLPVRVFAEYQAHPALRVLSGAQETASVEDLRSVLEWTNTRYILLHGSMLDADQRQRIERLLAPAASVEELEADLVLYRVHAN